MSNADILLLGGTMNNKGFKKYKLEWQEKILLDKPDADGTEFYLDHVSTMIDAKSLDEARQLWDITFSEKAYSGLITCVEMVKHPILKQSVRFTLPNKIGYIISADFLLRRHAEMNTNDHSIDGVMTYLIHSTIPHFDNDLDKLFAWAKANIDWEDIVYHSQWYFPKIKPETMQSFWENDAYLISA